MQQISLYVFFNLYNLLITYLDAKNYPYLYNQLKGAEDMCIYK